MEHILLGYAVPRGLKMMTEKDANMLTHVNLAFGLVREGLLSMEQWEDCLKEEMARVKKLNPRLKFVISIGGWGAGGFSEMAMTEKGRRDFAESVGKVLDEYQLDGVDIDWEYPCSPLAGIGYDPRDRENFTHLMAELRRVAGERIVSIAAGGGDYFVRDTEMDKVAQICDYVQLMTYDLRSGFDPEACHHTSLYAGEFDEGGVKNTAYAVEMFHDAGVPYEKIVIGAAFYGRRWNGVPDVNHGLMQQAATTGGGGGHYDILINEFINKNGFVRYWDDKAKAAWLFNGESLISYDDPEALPYKVQYLKDKGLLGIMYWEHSCDSTLTLLSTIYNELYK
ncbi:MAG: chitinase [Clostridiales bacterium]|nr:chitinase [Clostridiales bacterium]